MSKTRIILDFTSHYSQKIVLLITIGLEDMQLSTSAVMQVTGHKNESQMRRDYHTLLPP